MNATMTTAPGRQDHPPQQSSLERAPYQARRVSLLDRLALHVGIALIKWGRRPLAVPSREQRASRVEQQLARQQREREYERALRPFLPVR